MLSCTAKSENIIELYFCTNIRDAQYSLVLLFSYFRLSLSFLSSAVLSCLQFFKAIVNGSAVGREEESARRESTDSMCCTFIEAKDRKKKGEKSKIRGKA